MNAPGLKRSSALFLQVVLVLVGIGTLGLLLWEPHLEGRNVHATTFEIYFQDPFLAYVYVGSVPFFAALYRAFGLLGQIRRNGTLSPANLRDLRAIKYCAMAIIGFVAGAMIFVLWFGDGEDRPAGVFMGLLVALSASAIAVGAALFARRLQAVARSAEG